MFKITFTSLVNIYKPKILQAIFLYKKVFRIDFKKEHFSAS